ncbi:probable rRNA maturation factor [Ferrithrix thermotolerans DSM 19514]|jgi:probable rRNA maturation factor|uniref:Endoribonuclease YbeY n=1 Tax=Ferrithrix thermotolerans DSM 19514 TaxID=1121881 RepID=A0A1M4UT74_9ACTN|nr:rRNA maturation RNase YbeY [Ferrithrix thermotolerans]SHE59823.1 probable rRNA maturation factor [Ferrithrix thermotolerans DSM 19514]
MNIVPEVFVSNEQGQFEIDVFRWQELALAVLEAEKVVPNAELAVMFVEESVISELNERYMGKQGPTDVLSFPIAVEEADSGRVPDNGSSGPEFTSPMFDRPKVLLGDVVICPAVASRNCFEHKGDRLHRGTLDDEIALLLVHGILHLRGMDHEEEGEAEVMEAKEDVYLKAYYFDGELQR